jgi:hypothetical protein
MMSELFLYDHIDVNIPLLEEDAEEDEQEGLALLEFDVDDNILEDVNENVLE